MPVRRAQPANGAGMNFGIILGQTFTDTGQASFDQLRERVQVAEELGFDLVCLGDRHLWPSGFHEMLTTLAALAPVTRRIQLCSSGFILPIYNPILLAEQAAHVDVISGGRLIFGLVLGYREEELAISDVLPRQRRGRFLENLEVISRLWAGESVTFQGKFFRCRDVRIGPLPVRKPRPPIWIGGTADVVVRRSARLADGWLPSASLGRRELRQKVQVYRNALDEFGKQGSLVVARLGFVARSRARARALVEKPLLAQYRRYSGWMKDTPEGARYRYGRLDDFRDRLILGTPEECIEQVAFYRDMGADTLVYHCQHQGVPQREMLESMELFATRVMPAFSSG